MLLFPPSTQHTPTTGGEGELISQHAYYILSSLTTSCSPFHTTYPHHRGGRLNLSFSTLTIFCHLLLHLVPPSAQHTPTTGGEGGTMTIGRGGGVGGAGAYIYIYILYCLTIYFCRYWYVYIDIYIYFMLLLIYIYILQYHINRNNNIV